MGGSRDPGHAGLMAHCHRGHPDLWSLTAIVHPEDAFGSDANRTRNTAVTEF